MCSFKLEDSPLHFCLTFALACLVAASAVFLVTAVTDPLGVLSEQRLCAGACTRGIKTTNDRVAIPLLVRTREAQTYLFGTSRVRRGFAGSGWQRDSEKGGVMNASVSGQLIEETAVLIESVAMRAKASEFWIGLDFGMFLNASPILPVSTAAPHLHPLSDAQVYWHGVFAPDAVRALVNGLFSGRFCHRAYRDEYGFMADGVEASEQHYVDTPKSADQQLVDRFLLAKTLGNTTFGQRMRAFERMLRTGTIAGHRFHIFISPSPPRYFQALELAGVQEEYRRWSEQIRHLIKSMDAPEKQLRFHDFTGWYQDPEAGPCRSGAEAECPFYELTHYRPLVGERIRASFH